MLIKVHNRDRWKINHNHLHNGGHRCCTRFDASYTKKDILTVVHITEKTTRRAIYQDSYIKDNLTAVL